MKIFEVKNELEQMRLEVSSWKRKSEVDDLLRKFGDTIQVCMTRTKLNDLPCDIAVMPSDLFERYEELGLQDGEFETYVISVDIDDELNSKKLIGQVQTLLKAYENSIFNLADVNLEHLDLRAEIFYDEDKDLYYNIIEETCIIFNNDMQRVGTATVEELKVDENDNIIGVKYYDYEPTSHYTYKFDKNTLKGSWQ